MVVLNLLHHLVREGCRTALHCLKIFMEMSFHEAYEGQELPPRLNQLVLDFPVDLDHARKFFELEPETQTYACCPNCFSLYLPSEREAVRTSGNHNSGPVDSTATGTQWSEQLPYHGMKPGKVSTKAPYPTHCTSRETSDSPECGSALLRFNSEFSETDASCRRTRPIRTYKHQTLKSWLARLISRPGLEQAMDEIWDRIRGGSRNDGMSDIWDAEELRTFCGPDGQPFSFNPNNEGRYIFSLFVDWFNPLGNKQAGKSMSSGVIFMVCLNLPLHLRYKRENVYLVGVIPGPKAPRLQQINHILAVLVDDFLEFWTGVEFSQTSLYPHGRLMRCAVIPLVCDLGAGRKTAGHSSASATYFCSFCQLKKKDINSLDPTKWPRRTCEQHRSLAYQWRDATTVPEQEKHFKEYGVRYSELLRLPYWKPTQHIVIEVMHNLFLGLFHRHCRYIFGIDIKSQDEDEEEEEEASPISEEDRDRGLALLKSCCSADSLAKRLKRPVLRFLYENAGFGPAGKRTKAQLAELLTSKVGPRIFKSIIH